MSDTHNAAPAAPPSGGASTPSSTPAPASSPSQAAPTPSTPASPPSTPPQAAPSAAPSEPQPFDFNDILSGDAEVAPSIEIPAPTSAPALAQPVAPPAAEVVAQPPVEPAPTAAPQPGVGPQATPPQPAAQAPALLDPADPQFLATAIAQHEGAMIDHVAQTMFALTPEDMEALNTDAVSVIPKLMARSFVRSQQNMLAQLSRSVPQMIERHMKSVQKNDENSSKFYTRWPSIEKAKHGELVNQLAHTYRGMNPQATLDQMIEQLGPIVMMTAKIQPSVAPAPASNGAAGAPASRGPQPSPFQPAAAAAIAGTPPTEAEQNPWGILGGHDEG